MSDYYQSNGGWYKKDGGDGPYAKEGDTFTLMTGGSGSGGGAVDVLGTVVETLSQNTSKPVNGDSVQVILDKLTTFDNAFETEVRAVSLTGITFDDASDLKASDIVIRALGKLQAQLKALPETELTRILSTPLSLVTDEVRPESTDELGIFLNKIYHFMREHSKKTMSATSYGLLKEGEFPDGNGEFLSTDRLVTTLNKAVKHIKNLEAVNADLTARMIKVYNELGWPYTETP